MRRARRKQQREVLDCPDLQTTIETSPIIKQSLHHPLTMPAFPPRQLRRRKKQHQSAELHTVVLSTTQNLSEHNDKSYIKLPTIVRSGAAAMDKKGSMMDNITLSRDPLRLANIVHDLC